MDWLSLVCSFRSLAEIFDGPTGKGVPGIDASVQRVSELSDIPLEEVDNVRPSYKSRRRNHPKQTNRLDGLHLTLGGS